MTLTTFQVFVGRILNAVRFVFDGINPPSDLLVTQTSVSKRIVVQSKVGYLSAYGHQQLAFFAESSQEVICVQNATSHKRSSPTCVESTAPHPFDGTHEFTLILHLPLFYNPDEDGGRKPVEREKLEMTIAEIKRFFSGYTRSAAEGWCREDNVTDKHVRIEIDAVFDGRAKKFLKRWKLALCERFAQRDIYYRFKGPNWKVD